MSAHGSDSTRIKKICIAYYNLKQLAAIYSFSRYRMNKHLEEFKTQIGEPTTGYDYDPKQVALVFRLIPLPSNVQIVKA